jgi:DNA polymerase I-like protein with 3'-5' exonuclease and polymerase domains
VLPVHDALVVECPLDTFDECSKAVVDAMKLAALQYYPNTPLDVDINDQHPECWNKDGHADSIDRWLEDPFYSL